MSAQEEKGKGRIRRKRETVLLSDEIGEYLSKLTVVGSDGKRRRVKKGTIARSVDLLVVWQNIAPAWLVKHTDNVVYSKRSAGTELLIYVDSPAYAAELTLDKELYRFRIEQELKKPVTDITFLVSHKAAYRNNKGSVQND